MTDEQAREGPGGRQGAACARGALSNTVRVGADSPGRRKSPRHPTYVIAHRGAPPRRRVHPPLRRAALCRLDSVRHPPRTTLAVSR